MRNGQFYQCKDCETILFALHGKASHGCGQELVLLPCNSGSGSKEKHMPVLDCENETLTVKVGSAAHRTIPEHYIHWIFVQTITGGQYAKLTAADLPEAHFRIRACDVVAVYAYCNLHGLWRAELEEAAFDETVCSAEFPQGCIGETIYPMETLK